MTDKNFEQALRTAGKIVESWPALKQNSLLVTTMATTPAPRQPIDQPLKSSKDETQVSEASALHNEEKQLLPE